MNGADDITALERAALFVDDRELHRRINPAMKWEVFKASLAVAERDPSFPKVKALWGGRYWPAAKAWFDKNYGVSGNELTTDVEDKPESFNATPRRKARVQARAAPAAVLDRESGLQGPDGVSGNVHRLAPGRNRR